MGADVNSLNKEGTPILVVAAELTKDDIVQCMLDNGAYPNVQNKYGWTAVNYLADDGKKETLQKALDKGADINIPNKYGRIPLMYASKKHRQDIVAMFLDYDTDGINMQDNEGNTSLMHAVVGGDKKIVGMLLSKNADIHLKNKENEDALMIAVKLGKSEIAELLLQNGANPNNINNAGVRTIDLVKPNDVATKAVLNKYIHVDIVGPITLIKHQPTSTTTLKRAVDIFTQHTPV